jgi:hypothetical protein
MAEDQGEVGDGGAMGQNELKTNLQLAEALHRTAGVNLTPEQLAGALDRAERCGALIDAPEGARWIYVSDTFARLLSRALRASQRASEPVLTDP